MWEQEQKFRIHDRLCCTNRAVRLLTKMFKDRELFTRFSTTHWTVTADFYDRKLSSFFKSTNYQLRALLRRTVIPPIDCFSLFSKKYDITRPELLSLWCEKHRDKVVTDQVKANNAYRQTQMDFIRDTELNNLIRQFTTFHVPHMPEEMLGVLSTILSFTENGPARLSKAVVEQIETNNLMKCADKFIDEIMEKRERERDVDTNDHITELGRPSIPTPPPLPPTPDFIDDQTVYDYTCKMGAYWHKSIPTPPPGSTDSNALYPHELMDSPSTPPPSPSAPPLEDMPMPDVEDESSIWSYFGW